MIGIFDSGVGGLTALRELRRLKPTVDICYLSDSKNAPYGTKSESELLLLVKSDIERLIAHGAEHILMACCTASTVYPLLSTEERRICHPIITPTAESALRVTKDFRIGVIATERTVASHAFKDAILAKNSSAYVYELPTQSFVALVEGGECDGYASDAAKRQIKRELKPLLREKIDTLILGCTHFPHIKGIISEALGEINLVSCSKAGAEAIADLIKGGGDSKTEFIF